MFSQDLFSMLKSLFSIPVYRIEAPGEAAAPYIVFQRIDKNGNYTHDGRSYHIQRWQFSFYSQSMANVENYSKTLENYIDGKARVFSNTEMMSCFKDGAGIDTYDQKTKTYGMIDDYRISWK